MSTTTATALEIVTPLVKDWCAANADRIQACYLREDAEGRYTMIVVSRQEVFDDVLAYSGHQFSVGVYRSTRLVIDEWYAGPWPDEVRSGPGNVARAVRVFGE